MSDPAIPYGRQWIDEEDCAAVLEVLRGPYLTTGPGAEAFEAALASYTGAPHAVVLNSGTSALHAAYEASRLGPDDAIITSPLTFAATGNAALYLGAKVRFADIDPATGNIDPADMEALIDDRVRLLVPVDYAGHPADYDAIGAIAAAHGLAVVADAAHSLGASYKGRKVGTLADLTEVSFHPVKPITTGEGGAVLAMAAGHAARMKGFRSHGIVREPALLGRNEGPWYHEMQFLGFNYRMTDLQCALGLSQLRRLDGFIARRREIARRYSEAFASCPELLTPQVAPGVEPGWHLYVLRIQGKPGLRRPFFQALRRGGLLPQVHYLPVYLHPYYEALGYRPGLCPKAEAFYQRAVSIPLFPRMTDAEVDRVIAAVLAATSEVLR